MYTGSRNQGYKRVSCDEGDQACDNETTRTPRPEHFTLLHPFIRLVSVLVLCIVLTGLYIWGQINTFPAEQMYASCNNPDIRSEWRSTAPARRKEYLNAVTCLATKPSRLGLNQSLHHDFAYAHIWFGHDSHGGASFFAYHRWFLHLYEKALRDECHYRGNLIYWDWSLDWQDPYKAPIFDDHLGFGGEGPHLVKGIRGYCVASGPLPNYTIPFFETLDKPHCLSREFLPHADELAYWARRWNPEHIAAVLDEEDFPTFVSLVEEGPHLALPKILHGDFSTKGAPVDPIFMLHHANLDRLYWEWQRRKPTSRLVEYSGKKTGEDSKEIAGLEDRLMFGDLGRVVRVREIMNTESEALCYTYR